MNVFNIFHRKPRPLSADVLALLAQAHEVHQAEIEFARDAAREAGHEEARAEMRALAREIRDALFRPGTDSVRSDVGGVLVGAGLFSIDEWNSYVDARKAESAEFAVSGLQAARQREAYKAACNWMNKDNAYPLSAVRP